MGTWEHVKLGSSLPWHNTLGFFWQGMEIPQNTHLSMKEGSLFCFVVMRSTELGCFRSCSLCLWKALDEEGRMGFGSMTTI
jgi:hypothetical protein